MEFYMLYQMHEMKKQSLQPLLQWASITGALFTDPIYPFAHIPFARRISAACEMIDRFGKEYKKPKFDFNLVDCENNDIVIEQKTIAKKPFCNLLLFCKEKHAGYLVQKTKILLFAPLSGHHATLLRDMVQDLVVDHDVYVTDWIDAKMVPLAVGEFCLADYVAYAQEFIGMVGSDVHIIAVCQPTVPVLAAISLLASGGDETPRSITLMCGPIDARVSPTAVDKFAMSKSLLWIEQNLIHPVPYTYPGAARQVYPGFLQHAGFISMNRQAHIGRHQDYYRDASSASSPEGASYRQYYDEYNAVLDMPGAYYLDTVKEVFQDFSLAKGEMSIDGHDVRPQDIKNTALLTIEGEKDEVIGAGQTHAAHALCAAIPASNKRHVVALGASHFNLFSGEHWKKSVFPVVREFIGEFIGEMQK
jgi:poly(3-hydroxybutyrate) depolymerase